MLQNIKKKIWDFLIENDIPYIGFFTFLSVICYKAFEILFSTAGEVSQLKPTTEPFYYAIFSVAIWSGFWFVIWTWARWNFPEIVKILKETNSPCDGMRMTYEKALIFIFVLFFSLVAVAWVVFKTGSVIKIG